MVKSVCFFLVCLLLFSTLGWSQTVFWTEDYTVTGWCNTTQGNGAGPTCLADNYTSTNGTWTVYLVPGGNGNEANTWYISCMEDGMQIDQCGATCFYPNPSLHVANVSTSPLAFFFCPDGDCGAAYDAGGFAGYDVESDQRATSPIIDCTGRTGITIGFKYIGEGVSNCSDGCVLEYSSDGGSTWSQISASCLQTNNNPCGGQGNWTLYGPLSLPSSADNNPNVMIGFRWENNNNGVGTDPSFAVDSVALASSSLALLLRNLQGIRNTKSVSLSWETLQEADASTFKIERSANGIVFEPAGEIFPRGGQTSGAEYTYEDVNAPLEPVYYRIKQINTDQVSGYTGIIRVDASHNQIYSMTSFSAGTQQLTLNFDAALNCGVQVRVLDISGQIVVPQQLVQLSPGQNTYTINIESLSKGIFFCQVIPVPDPSLQQSSEARIFKFVRF